MATAPAGALAALVAATCWLCTVAAGAGARSGVSPVQKVIALIEEMASKVKADMDQQTRDFQEFASYCDREASAKEYAVKESKSQVEELTATVQEASADIEAREAQISDYAAQISATEGEVRSSVAVREKEHAGFVDAEKELDETTDQLVRAIATLKKTKGQSLAQLSPNQKSRLSDAVHGVGVIVGSLWATRQQREALQAFLQEREDSEDGLAAQTPDAIIETLIDMKDKAEGQLAGTRKAEMEAMHSYEMLKQGMENEVSGLKKEMAETSEKKQASGEDLAQAQKDLATEEKALSESEAFLRELRHQCQTKAGDFEVEMKDQSSELDALGKAKAILTKQFAAASFLQTSSQTRLLSRLSVAARTRAASGTAARAKVRFYGQLMDENKAAALRVIDQLGHKLHSMSLISLAFRAAQDPFGKIRSMIEDMIEKLLQEAAEEADQKAFCEKEIGSSQASQANKNQKLETINARLANLESTTATLTEEVAKLRTEVSEIDAAISQATEIRQKEKQAAGIDLKDYTESQQACAAAIEVLQEYYQGASFLQVSARASAKSGARTRVRSATRFKFRLRDDGDGGGIIGLLEVAESDFANMIAETNAVEGQAQGEFEKMLQENKVLKATKLTEVAAKESQIKSIKTSVDEFSSDKDSLASELDAVKDYLDKLKPQCDTKTPSYEEKKAEREEEIAGLKDALSMLDGTGVF